MSRGKTIQVFLMDGDPSQRIKCTLQNWTGIVYKIPRTMLDECKDGYGDIVKHLKQTGIYFLLGQNADTGINSIYIGQAVVRKNGEGLLYRINEHKRNNKERYWNDWNEAIVLTTQNNSFGPTEISYLENQFTDLAKKANRYDILNGNDPNQGNVTEEKESELQEYIDYARMIIGVMGHTVFEPMIKPLTINESKESTKSITFIYKGKLDAKGVLTNEGFVLLKGSALNVKLSKSAHEFTVKARKQYASKILDGHTTEDILFSSPSAAAGFVGGCSLSGNVMWRTEDDKSPKDF